MKTTTFPLCLLPRAAVHSVMCLCMQSCAFGEGLLTNGSFESPVVTSNWMDTIVPSSWTTTGPSALLANGMINLSLPWSGFPYPTAQDGVQWVYVGATSSFSQPFVVTNAERHLLTWFETTVVVPGSANTAALYSATITLEPSQTIVASRQFDGFHREWLRRYFSFDLSPGAYRVSFGGTGLKPYVQGAILDNVELIEQPEDLQGRLVASAVDFCWSGRTNQMYQVQYKTLLSNENWTNLGDPIRGNGTNSLADRFLGQDRRFYRVIRVP